MKKLILASLLAMTGTVAFAECSYSTYISDEDKYNSSGTYLANTANKTSVAAILRQNRVYSGETACGLHNTNNRASFEAKVRKSNLSPKTIKSIVHGNPYVTVTIYKSHVAVEVEE